MLDLDQAIDRARSAFPYQMGAFYGAAKGLGLGAGLIFDSISYPLFDKEERLFDTVAGPVYVLTHECDVDQVNARHFNELVLVCPIVPFEHVVQELCDAEAEDKVFISVLPNLASDKVFRVMYLPEGIGPTLPFGGFIFLNQICSTHVSEFPADGAMCALSEYAQGIVDKKLLNHFLRPKQDQLPRLR